MSEKKCIGDLIIALRQAADDLRVELESRDGAGPKRIGSVCHCAICMAHRLVKRAESPCLSVAGNKTNTQ